MFGYTLKTGNGYPTKEHPNNRIGFRRMDHSNALHQSLVELQQKIQFPLQQSLLDCYKANDTDIVNCQIFHYIRRYFIVYSDYCTIVFCLFIGLLFVTGSVSCLVNKSYLQLSSDKASDETPITFGSCRADGAESKLSSSFKEAKNKTII